MNNNKKFFEFKADFIVAGTMYVNNQTEITYKQIQNFIKNLNENITSNGDMCLILFSNEYLKELKYDYGNVFYIGNNVIGLNEGYDLHYLIEKILSYKSLETLQYLEEIKNKKLNKNEKIL